MKRKRWNSYLIPFLHYKTLKEKIRLCAEMNIPTKILYLQPRNILVSPAAMTQLGNVCQHRVNEKLSSEPSQNCNCTVLAPAQKGRQDADLGFRS